MNSIFETAFDFTSRYEGLTGGISQEQYDRYLKTRGRFVFGKHIPVDIITDTEIAEIWLCEYWEPLTIDLIPGAIGIALFDFAVSQTSEEAVKVLQSTLLIVQSGNMESTRMAIDIFCRGRKENENELTKKYLLRRRAFLQDRSLLNRTTIDAKEIRRIGELEKLLLT